MHHLKIIILIICFTFTSIFIYWQPSSKALKKQIPLSEAFTDIHEWHQSSSSPLSPQIVASLELDDYVNQSYSNGQDTVSLYIGYYITSNKVGAAHSPLVCFPGQGWILSDAKEKSIKVGKDSVHFLNMLVTKSQRKELILYWFQAYDRTSPGTFLQKLNILWAKFIHSREDNAFVRVSIPINKQSENEAYITGVKFIKDFYPAFLEYIKNG